MTLSLAPMQDFIILGPFQSPGRAIVRSLQSPRDWKINKAYGQSGASLIYTGANLAKFEVDISERRLCLHCGSRRLRDARSTALRTRRRLIRDLRGAIGTANEGHNPSIVGDVACGVESSLRRSLSDDADNGRCGVERLNKLSRIVAIRAVSAHLEALVTPRANDSQKRCKPSVFRLPRAAFGAFAAVDVAGSVAVSTASCGFPDIGHRASLSGSEGSVRHSRGNVSRIMRAALSDSCRVRRRCDIAPSTAHGETP